MVKETFFFETGQNIGLDALLWLQPSQYIFSALFGAFDLHFCLVGAYLPIGMDVVATVLVVAYSSFASSPI